MLFFTFKTNNKISYFTFMDAIGQNFDHNKKYKSKDGYIVFVRTHTRKKITLVDKGRIFFFSNLIEKVTKSLRFYFSRFFMWLRVLFKWRKELRKNSIDFYYSGWQFDGSVVAIKFEFKNAIWYRVAGKKFTSLKKPVVIPLPENFTGTVNFEVFGFFKRQVIPVEIRHQWKISENAFYPKMTRSFVEQVDLRKVSPLIPELTVVTGYPQMTLSNVATPLKKIEINHDEFNINEYI